MSRLHHAVIEEAEKCRPIRNRSTRVAGGFVSGDKQHRVVPQSIPPLRVTEVPQSAASAGLANSAIARSLGSPRLQPKLTVSAPGDASEREADRLAEQVLRMPAPEHTAQGTPGLESHAGAPRGGGGDPLPASERDFFQSRFGRDFGDVRVHTGTEAADLAQQVDARAFTLGREIV